MGSSLPGTIGATPRDQGNIDETVAGGCSVGVYTKSECARHTEALRKQRAKAKNLSS